MGEAADDWAWAGQLGPVYRAGDVARLLGTARQAVSADRRLLRLELSGGDVGYPVFQFEGRRELVGVGDVVVALAPVVASAWTTASWLTSPQPDLGGRRPVDLLREGRADAVTAAARRVAPRFDFVVKNSAVV